VKTRAAAASELLERGGNLRRSFWLASSGAGIMATA
jgi:hypothetical protein